MVVKCVYDGQEIEGSVDMFEINDVKFSAHSEHDLKSMIGHLMIDPTSEFNAQVDIQFASASDLRRLVSGMCWNRVDHMPMCRECLTTTTLKDLTNYRGKIVCGDCSTAAEFA